MNYFFTACLSLWLVGVAAAQPSMKISPEVVKPNQPVNLTFQVKEGDQVLTDFDVVHEKTSHLILVSGDYLDFQHVHPDLDATGKFTMKDVVFARPGLYYVFLDVTPQGSKQIVKRFEVNVEGKGQPLVLKEDTLTRGLGDIRVQLKSDPFPLKKGDAQLHFQLTRQGKPVTNIKPFMGAMGHVIALGKDGAPFLHVHPLDAHDNHGDNHAAAYSCPMHPEVQSDKPGSCPKCGMKLQAPTNHPKPATGEVIFHANFPAAGLYKVWGQFQIDETMLIVPYTIRVH